MESALLCDIHLTVASDPHLLPPKGVQPLAPLIARLEVVLAQSRPPAPDDARRPPRDFPRARIAVLRRIGGKIGGKHGSI